jgi:acyl carrier protein
LALSTQEVREWLLARVAATLQIEPGAIDVHEPLYVYGFDSIAASSLAGELEEWLGRRLPETLLLDHPTIDGLAQFLTVRRSDCSAGPAV